MHPATATAWYFWKEHRWMVTGGIIAFPVIVVLSHLLPDSHHYVVARIVVAVPFVAVMFPRFAYAMEADLAGRASMFPARMFTQPRTTCALVGWPMLYGTCAIALMWVAVVQLVFRPGGFVVPRLWPALILATTMAWFQALAWRPFALPWMRLVVATGATIAATALVAIAIASGCSANAITMGLAATIPLAYVTAVRGLSRARRGDEPDWRWLWERTRHAARECTRCVPTFAAVGTWLSSRAKYITCGFVGQPPSFPSAEQAQVWYETRRNAIGTWVLTVLGVLLASVMVIFSQFNPMLAPESPLRSPLLLLLVPLWVAPVTGGLFGRCGPNAKNVALTAFLGTRPLTSKTLVAAKFRAATRAGLVALAITLVACLILMTALNGWATLAAQWRFVTGDMSPVQRAALPVVAGLVLVILGVWKPLLVNMCIGLTGRRWLISTAAGGFGVVLAIVCFVAGWLHAHSDYHDFGLATLPWVLGAVAAFKLVLGAWTLSALHRHRVFEPRWIILLPVVWLAAVLTLVGLARWYLPSPWAPWQFLLSIVILFVPLVRLAAAPLALAWNRHR
ncbi:MAG: hypothetical protein JW818_14440 [Pirellulales bacterium]|nr:hypothetical protein [Pirellulales bacterium]